MGERIEAPAGRINDIGRRRSEPAYAIGMQLVVDHFINKTVLIPQCQIGKSDPDQRIFHPVGFRHGYLAAVQIGR